ncbi:MAG: DUF4827 family protein [Paludibacter sp.]|nr:DUF4827 family protein [Paludibacter sp.]
MIKIIRVVIFLFFILLITNACNDKDVTYAEELKAEKKLIADFISRQNIKVVTTMPTGNWPDNVYYKSRTGLYFRLTNQGDVASQDSVEAGDLVVPRFIQYELVANNPDTIFNMNTINSPYPLSFVYLNTAQACLGWHEAVGYMKKNNSEAKIIVYSKLGFSQYADPATPIGYDIKIKIQKN